MKLKFVISISLFLVYNISFCQDFEYGLTSVKSIDNQIIEEQYSTDKVHSADRLLVVQTPPVKRNNKDFYSKKEWKKIKKQLKKNKKRISKQKIHAYKKIDTIYIDIPTHKNRRSESRLSGW